MKFIAPLWIQLPEHVSMLHIARKQATIRQPVQADKRCKPLRQPFSNGSRVLDRGRPYTSSPGRSKKLEPRWFGPFTVAGHNPDTDNYKQTLPRRKDRQKPFFHVSSLKDYRKNDPDRFASRRMDRPAPILIDNAEEWEAEDILDYRLQNNCHELLVHWKGYERAETLENLSRTSNTPLNLSRNTGKRTTPQNQLPRSLPTRLKQFGNLWKYLPHPAKPALHPTISGNPMTMRNMTPATLKLITSLATMMTYYCIRRTARKATRTGREFDISK